MPPLFNDSEIRQLLEDISADENLGGEGGGEADPRRVSVILGEIPSDPRRVSVIQVEKRCTAPGGWLDTATITSYALSLLQVYMHIHLYRLVGSAQKVLCYRYRGRRVRFLF